MPARILRGAGVQRYPADVLFLDDLGAQQEKPWETELLFQILDWRLNSDLPTFMTTNHNPGGAAGDASRVHAVAPGGALCADHPQIEGSRGARGGATFSRTACESYSGERTAKKGLSPNICELGQKSGYRDTILSR